MPDPIVTPPGTTTPAPGTTDGGTPPAWYAGFPEEDRGYLEQKGFKDAQSVVKSYRNLESLHSAGPERLIKLPEKLDDDKALGEIFGKLGRPEKADGYKLDVPEGLAPDFAEWAKGTFHGLGLTKRQGDQLGAAWNARIAETQTKMDTEFKNAQQQQVEKLKQEWGLAYEQNRGQVDKFAQMAGISSEQAVAMSQILGIDGLHKMLHGVVTKFGLKLDEPGFSGGADGGNNFNVLSPAGAKSKIAELRADAEWSKRYLNGGQAELAEMKRLTQWAYPE